MDDQISLSNEHQQKYSNVGLQTLSSQLKSHNTTATIIMDDCLSIANFTLLLNIFKQWLLMSNAMRVMAPTANIQIPGHFTFEDLSHLL